MGKFDSKRVLSIGHGAMTRESIDYIKDATLNTNDVEATISATASGVADGAALSSAGWTQLSGTNSASLTVNTTALANYYFIAQSGAGKVSSVYGPYKALVSKETESAPAKGDSRTQ